MALKPGLEPTVNTGLVLTPQQLQTIKLIQTNKVELVELVQQELTENPALEENVGPDPEVQVAAVEGDQEGRPGDVEGDSQDDWGPDDWEKFKDYLQTGGGVRGAAEVGRAAPIDNILVNQETLATYLTAQIGVRLDDESAIRVCEAIIGNLNDAGYLDATLEEIQELGEGEWSRADVEAGLSHVQALDPRGVGARDLRECLLLQIRADVLHSELAETLIRNHYEDCQLSQISKLAKRLGVVEEDVRVAIESINGLDKEPGLTWVPYEPEYLMPDVKVVEDNGSYRVEMVEQGMPRVFVNRNFMPICENAAEEKFRKEKLESARNLMKAIDQRKKTIIKVAESIVRYQERFMEIGPTGLRPLILQEIASEIDMHESTVSRVVSNKAIDTPRGVFEMKVFFPTKIPCRNGEYVSSVVVKLRIRDIIHNENPEKPLSDSKILTCLQEDGYVLARRTVAKYREELRFSSASQRKVVGL